MSRNEPASAAHRPDPRRVETVFSDALAHPVSERADFLDRACGANAMLRAREAAARRLRTTSGGLRGSTDVPLEDDALDGEEMRSGQRIGPMNWFATLASGGMGTVWLARRADEHP
jgi:hypothetical protein